MIITTTMLKKKRACPDQVALFATTFPEGCPVTLATLQVAQAAGLDLNWAAGHLLPAAALEAAYRASLKPLEEAYRASTQPLDEAYYASLKPLYEAYEAGRKPLDDAHDASRKPLEAAYWASRKTLDDAHDASRKPLDEAYWASRKTLYEAYEAGLTAALYEAAAGAGLAEHEGDAS